MKDAKAADALRRLRTRADNWKTKLQRVSVTDLPTIGTIEIPIQSPLTVLAGPNGVGKTTLLRAIWASLEPADAAEYVSLSRRLNSGSALVDILSDGVLETAEVRFTEDQIEITTISTIRVTHIDSAAHTPGHQKRFCSFQSVEEIVNGAGARELDSKALAEVCFLTTRNYRSVTLYEVELDGVAPFFEVSYGNNRYDSRTMGTGELATLYIWWAVKRAEINSVLLIEEPEAFLSYGCQISLSRFIVSSIVDRQLVAVVTSHSPAFITSLPKECLVFLSRSQNGISVSNVPVPIVLKTMGIDLTIKAYVFVEDEMARLFLRQILEKYDALLSRQVFIDQRGGEGEIRTALKTMTKKPGPIRFVGMFDGDMRNTEMADIASFSVFLPGVVALEETFRKMVSENPDGLEKSVGNPNVTAILGALEGKDHHDWYRELAAELGLSSDQLFVSLIAIWMQVPGNDLLAFASYESLHTMLNPNVGDSPN